MPYTMQFATTINRPPTAVFDLLADLGHYSRWLSPSGTFQEITQPSAEPTRLGTTYTDSSVMQGSVTEFAPPNRLTFSQETTFHQFLLNGRLRIEMQYTLTSEGSGTHVTRTVTMNTQGIFRLLQPFVV